METLTQPEELQMLNGVKKAVDLVDNQNLSPDAALEKVARDYKWSPGALRSAVSAFNNGRQVAQWRANDTAMDKLADFQLADYADIYDKIWGSSVEKAAADISPEYKQPPSWLRNSYEDRLRKTNVTVQLEKTAADHDLDSAIAEVQQERDMVRAYNAHAKEKRAFDDTRTKYALAHDMVRVYTRMLEGYFKKAAMDRLPFAAVEKAAAAYYGLQGRALFDLLAKSFPNEKRAADTRVYCEAPIDFEQAPLAWVKKAVDAAKEVFHMKESMDLAATRLEKTAETLRPFVQTSSNKSSQRETLSTSLIDDGMNKTAIMGALGLEALRETIRQHVGSAGAKDDVNSNWLDLEDPDHDNEMRKIRAQAMLNGMMSDPENPISGYDPEEVLSRYNELSQLTPRAIGQPAALQPMLLRSLAGNRSPFDVKEDLDIEKGLRESKAPTPKTKDLLDAPDSLLG